MRTRIAGVVGVFLVGSCSSPVPAPEPEPNRVPTEERVASVQSMRGVLKDRVCLERDGQYILQVEARDSEAAASADLTMDTPETLGELFRRTDADGNYIAEGEYVAGAMRLRGQEQRQRSEPVALHAGEPCHLISAYTGVVGSLAVTRLIRLVEPASN